MAYTEILLILPPFDLIITAILLGISFAVLYMGKKIIRLGKEDVKYYNGSIRHLVFKAWGVNVAAFFAALIIMGIISSNITFFESIHSEFASSYENASLVSGVYVGCLAFLHMGFLFLSYFVFKKEIIDKSKRNKMVIIFVAASTLIWGILLCLVFRVF